MRFTKQKIDEINAEISKLNDKLTNISGCINDIVQLVLSEEESDSASTNDNVNHPSHYETENFECIDVMIETQGKEAVMDFCVCNAFKYIYRHNNKNGVEDVKKAKWYLDKYIELSEK
nr:MAG TPA: nucelotide kinase [Caudoviricetes sp.]